jgi:hypothetical protein
MNVLVTGSTGFIGSALVRYMTGKGHEVTRLVRQEPLAGEGQVRWDPDAGAIDSDGLTGTEVVIHLAAEKIGAKRWTPKQKARILNSRVQSTSLLVETIVGLDPPPKTLLCASSDVYYGDRGDQVLREESPPGSNFLAGVTSLWEATTEPAARRGIRVVNLRFGMVIGPQVKKMLTHLKLGLGSRLGNGKQFVSWITLDDAIRAVHHLMDNESIEGPVNVVTPHPVRNAEFMQSLGRVLERPARFPVPALLLRLMHGEMVDIDLVSAWMEPAKLRASGFEYDHPELEGALRAVLGRPLAM